MTYNITAVAENDFGPSQPSAVFQYTTPVPANAPILDFVEVLPPTDREAFGSLAITINTTADGGSRECCCSIVCRSLPATALLRPAPPLEANRLCPRLAAASLPVCLQPSPATR